MKKHLIVNLGLSLGLFIILSAVRVGLNHQPPIHYYLTIGFFFFTYLFQALFLFKKGNTNSRFLTTYNYTTLLKMLLSSSFLIVCYLVFEKSSDMTQKMQFSIFFLVTYFIYLIVNVKSFFSSKNEKKKNT